MKSSQLLQTLNGTVLEGATPDEAEEMIETMTIDEEIVVEDVQESDFTIQDIVPANMREIVVSNEANIDDDFAIARKNIMEIASRGGEALETALELIKATEHPRSIEVAANLMKTLTDINASVLDLHEKKRKIKEKAEPSGDGSAVVQHNTQNNFFVGTTKELLERKKQLSNP